MSDDELANTLKALGMKGSRRYSMYRIYSLASSCSVYRLHKGGPWVFQVRDTSDLLARHVINPKEMTTESVVQLVAELSELAQ
jgi:hypothetical protein